MNAQIMQTHSTFFLRAQKNFFFTAIKSKDHSLGRIILGGNGAAKSPLFQAKEVSTATVILLPYHHSYHAGEWESENEGTWSKKVYTLSASLCPLVLPFRAPSLIM